MENSKILIVEDNGVVAEDIRIKLGHMGYKNTFIATSYEKAIKAAESQLPDLALMDIELGGDKNGIDTASELRKEYQVPVVYLTAYADDDTIARAKITEPYGYIVKPFDDNELKSAIEIALYKHQTERQLKVSQQWYETTLNSIGDGVITTDMDGCISFINPVAENLTGWTIREALGKPLETVFNIINEVSGEVCENPVKKVIQTGQIIGLANRTLLIAKDGRRIPIKDSGAPIQLNGIEKLGVVLVFQDDTENRKAQQEILNKNKLLQSEITERKRVEEALKENTQRMELALQGGGLGIWDWNTETNEVCYDNQWAKMKGYRLEELEPDLDFFRHLIHPDDLQATDERMHSYLGGETESYSSEFRIKSKSGEWIWIQDRGKVVEQDENGKPLRVCGTHQDITERKQAESLLLENEEKLKILFDISPLAISITEIETGKIVDVNKKFAEFSKYSKDEIIGKTSIELGAYSNEERQKFIDILKSEGSVNGYEVDLTIKGGLRITTLMFANIVQLPEKPYILAAFLDVSDKKRLEAELIQAHKMEAIGTLAGGIAHDFNNVLSSIIGFTELALDDAKQGTAQEDNLQEVYKAGKRAKDLVWQILTFARETEEPTKPIQVDIIVKEVLKFIRSSIPTSIEIRQNIDSNSLIMSNPTQAHQIIMNLCTNAAYAMDESGGILEVGLKDVAIDKTSAMYKEGLKPGDYIEIKVSDTGSGISSDVIDSIFEPYFTTKAPGEGTGMGLAVVDGIVEKSGGKIRVESQLGEGTVIRVYQPITKKRQVQHLYETEELPSGTERILFVDDEAPIAKMGSWNLEGLGYSVTTRTSSIEALELFRIRPNDFDLIITDMTMPNMTGDVLAAEAMIIRPDIPVILCTGYSKRISDESASEIGIKEFAYKPIVKADLAKTVRKVLDEAKATTYE